MKIFYGAKGTGKTKAIIEDANKTVNEINGHLVFITNDNKHSFDLNHEVRYIDITNYSIDNENSLSGFIKGIVAANTDNEKIYIDGISRITNKALKDLKNLFTDLENLEKQFNVEFVLTCSSIKEQLPEFIIKHI